MTLESGKNKLITTEELSGKLGKLDKEIKNSNKAEWNKEKKGAVSVGKDKNGAHVYAYLIPQNFEGLNKAKTGIAKQLGIKNPNHFGIFRELNGQQSDIVPKKGEKVYLKYVADGVSDVKTVQAKEKKIKNEITPPRHYQTNSFSMYPSHSDFVSLKRRLAESGGRMSVRDGITFSVVANSKNSDYDYVVECTYDRRGQYMTSYVTLKRSEDESISISVINAPAGKNPDGSPFVSEQWAIDCYHSLKRAF